MEVINFLKVYDDVLPTRIIDNLLDFSKNFAKFEESKVINHGNTPVVDFNVRRTYVCNLDMLSKSMSVVHWGQFLSHIFRKAIDAYRKDLNISDLSIEIINTPIILKYENTGFYTWHVDHCRSAPRTLSCILMLNDDYEGGNLCIRDVDGSNEKCIDVRKNRLIVWPSNFMYPHTVKPVTKGTRYSVVSWAI